MLTLLNFITPANSHSLPVNLASVSDLLPPTLYGLLGILTAELARDCYHLAGHYWSPLIPWHNLHHKAYRPDFSKTSEALYRRAELLNDVPEALFMVAVTALVGWWVNPALWLGCAYAGGFCSPVWGDRRAGGVVPISPICQGICRNRQGNG